MVIGTSLPVAASERSDQTRLGIAVNSRVFAMAVRHPQRVVGHVPLASP
jgi:hypothetical protein